MRDRKVVNLYLLDLDLSSRTICYDGFISLTFVSRVNESLFCVLSMSPVIRSSTVGIPGFENDY